jgi:hypothetical protein
VAATASHLHVPEALAGIVADIKAQQPDHIALTGDLVNISPATEFARAADWLATLGGPTPSRSSPATTTSMSPTAWPEARPVGAYIAGDGQPPATTSTSSRPAPRGRRGPGRLSSGVPKPPLLATGTLGERRSPGPSACWPIRRARAVPRRADPPSAAHQRKRASSA